jgi:hypothetical protein
MNKSHKKPKIERKGKSYGIKDSPLYKITSKKKLISTLFQASVPITDLEAVVGDYDIFLDQKNPNKARTIEKPNYKLDRIHSRIASLLCRIKTPDYVHSGVKKRSHVSNAKSHLADINTFTTDIKSFFPSTLETKVFTFFYLTMSCAPDVSRLLARLCTCNGHVPTGSRISMPLAYWANSNMFQELNELSVAHGVVMTVYVDDISFSGDSVNKLFIDTVEKIIVRHDHIMHPKKSKLYRKGTTKIITGVAIRNEIPLAKNEQHKSLYQDIELLKGFVGNIPPPEGLVSRAIGRCNALSTIDSRFKDKARSLTREFKRKL